MFRVAGEVIGRGVIQFSPENIVLEGMDIGQVIYIKSVISGHFFEEFSVPQTMKIAYDMENLYKIIRLATKGAQNIEITLDSTDSLKITTSSIDGYERTFTEKALALEYYDTSAPTIQYPYYAEVNLGRFRQAITEARTCGGNKVMLTMSLAGLGVASTSSTGGYDAMIPTDTTPTDSDVRAVYNTDFILRAIPEVGDYARVGFDENGVLHVVIDDDGVKHEAFIAPRVDVDSI